MVREKFIVHTPDGEATFEDIELAKDFALTFTPADEVYIDRAIMDIDDVVVKETVISKEDLVDLMKSPFDMEYEEPEYAKPDELVASEPIAVEEDDFRNMHEALEAREDLVECQECFELFPKSECRKLVYGYICPACGQAYVEKEIPVAVVEIEPDDFNQEFPAPVDFEEKEEEPETTINAVPAEATPVVDEKEKVEEKIDFGGLNINIDAAGQNNAFGMGGSNPKVEGLNEEAAAVDHYEIHFVNPEDEKEFGGAEYFKSLEDAQAKCAEFANDGHSCEIKKLICNDGICSLVSLDEPNAVNEGIHDKSRETIENEQELHGVDNAVVDCKKYTLVAHSEDEKPVDCKIEKPALEEPLAGEKVDVKLYEAKKDPAFEGKLQKEYIKRLEKYAPEFGFNSAEELEAAMEDDYDLYEEVIEYDDGDNFLDLYLHWWPDEKGFAAEDEYYGEPLKDLLADRLSESLTEEVADKPWILQQGEDGEPEFIGWAKTQNEILDKMVKNHASDSIGENTYISELDDKDIYLGFKDELEKEDIEKLNKYFGLNESLEEAKKDEDELPPDPGAVKVEVHGMLNNLVADEIEAIDGYEEAKADIIEQPIEHKDEIIATIDHIKDEEKEHIDELIDAASEIPFDKEHEEPAPVEEPVIEEPIIEPEVEESLKNGKVESHEDEVIDKLIGVLRNTYALEGKDLYDACLEAGMTKEEVEAFVISPEEFNESLTEASSAEKKAYNDGSNAQDLVLGRAIARIKDPKARDAAIAAMKAGRQDVVKQFTGDRKIDQSIKAFDQKQNTIDKAINKAESLEVTIPQDLEDDRTPVQEPSTELEKPVDIIDTARGQEIANRHLDEKCAAEVPFDCEANIGDKIRIIHLEGEGPDYDGKEGIIEYIDSLGQLHGTWGGLAVLPGVDDFEVITNESLLEEITDEVVCGWCGEKCDKSECRHEVDFGWLCRGCEQGLKSRGETLTFIENED